MVTTFLGVPLLLVILLKDMMNDYNVMNFEKDLVNTVLWNLLV